MLPQTLMESRQIVDELRRQRHPVFDLSTGGVLLTPSKETVDTVYAPTSQRFEYTNSIGSQQDRSALADSIRDSLGLRIEVDQVALCAGATEGVFLAIASGTEEWTAVRPGWHTFPRMVEMLGRRANSIPVEHLAAKARSAKGDEGIFLQSPINPTGEIIPNEQLIEAFHSGSAQFLFDLTYLGISTSTKHDLSQSVLRTFAADWRRTTLVFSLSKLFRVPGLRLGFIVASAETIGKISQCKAATSLNFPANMQHLAGRLWPSHPREQATVQTFLQERDEWFHEVCEQHGIWPILRQGTHFRVFDFAQRYVPIQRELLAAGVVCAPAREMGIPNAVRINLSSDRRGLEQFVRIVSAH